MGLFEKLGQHPGNSRQITPQEAMQQLRGNPSETLRQAGLTIPAGMNDPQQIINHLLHSGQVSNPRLQMAQRMMGMMRR